MNINPSINNYNVKNLDLLCSIFIATLVTACSSSIDTNGELLPDHSNLQRVDKEQSISNALKNSSEPDFIVKKEIRNQIQKLETKKIAAGKPHETNESHVMGEQDNKAHELKGKP
ncbi:hypothetical protein, partial [Enterovibrio norvegicus]